MPDSHYRRLFLLDVLAEVVFIIGAVVSYVSLFELVWLAYDWAIGETLQPKKVGITLFLAFAFIPAYIFRKHIKQKCLQDDELLRSIQSRENRLALFLLILVALFLTVIVGIALMS